MQATTRTTITGWVPKTILKNTIGQFKEFGTTIFALHFKDISMKKKLFDEYLFADYSGGGEDSHAQGNIALFTLSSSTGPQKLSSPSGNTNNFSRDRLTSFVLDRLTDATNRQRRIVFGFDHQYGWPLRLRRHANLESLDWRTSIKTLTNGSQNGEMPPFDIPKRYCHLFNRFTGHESFWTPFKRVASSYGITTQKPEDPIQDRFRLTELVRPLKGAARPKPADAVGGTGEGIVGGQTICGLRQLAKMLHRSDIAWWPFDGLDILSAAYIGKHVGVEIYPSAVRPGQQQSDEHDATETCLAVNAADEQGHLEKLMRLNIPIEFQNQVLREGWIIGMDAADLENGYLCRNEKSKERSRGGSGKVAAADASPTYPCPIEDCNHVFHGSRGGWDPHVASPKKHKNWRKDLSTGEERKKAFQEEFPEFFM